MPTHIMSQELPVNLLYFTDQTELLKPRVLYLRVFFAGNSSIDYLFSQSNPSMHGVCYAIFIKSTEENRIRFPYFKVPLRSNCRYPFFYIFVHNKSFRKILPNFNVLQTLELSFFGPLFPRI